MEAGARNTWHSLVVALTALLCGQGAEAAPPTELRHGSYVHAVLFTPNGKLIASASNDQTIRLWAADTGKQVAALPTPRAYVRALAISADGRTFAAGTKEGTIIVWDLETGKERHRLAGHDGAVHTLAFAPDGQLLVSGGEEGLLLFWDARAGKELRRVTTPQKKIHAIVFTADGKRLATAGRDDPSIIYWEAASGKELQRSNGRHGGIAALAFSPAGKTLAAVGSGPVRFYDPLTLADVGLQPVRFEGSFDGVYALAYAPDGKYLATGGQDRSVRLWELATEQEVHVWRGHHDWIYSVAFAPDGRTLAVADHGHAIRLWRVAEESDEAPAALWSALAGGDAVRAHRAVWKLSATPERSVPFLRARLRALPAGQRSKIDQWIKDLDSEDFQTRERASSALARANRAAEPALHKALAGPLPSLEMRRRIERILPKIGGPINDPDLLRALRVTAVLERASTPDARSLLDELATTGTHTWLQHEAKAALDRLGRRGGRRGE